MVRFYLRASKMHYFDEVNTEGQFEDVYETYNEACDALMSLPKSYKKARISKNNNGVWSDDTFFFKKDNEWYRKDEFEDFYDEEE